MEMNQITNHVKYQYLLLLLSAVPTALLLKYPPPYCLKSEQF